MTPVMQQFFERLGDGILIVVPGGRIRFINEAARRHLPFKAGDTLPEGPLLHFASSALAGHLQIPASIELEFDNGGPACGAEPAQVHAVRSPVGDELILIVQACGDAHFFRSAVNNLEQMIERELGQSLDTLDSAFHKLLAELSLSTPDVRRARELGATLSQSGQDMLGMLRRLASLASLSAGHDILASDRIVLDEWLPAATARFVDEARSRGIAFGVSQPPTETGPVYGSRIWLDRALNECLDNALKYCPKGGSIKLEIKPCTHFVRVMILSSGIAPQSLAQRERLTQPFFRGPNASGTPGLGIGLPLARQIIELQGGHLLITPDLDGFFRCTIELPTGRSPRTAAQDEAAQLERYAHDLAQIIKQGRRPVTP